MEIQYTTAHIADLERSIFELKEKKRVLTNKKIEYQNSLSQLNRHSSKDKNARKLISEVKTKLTEIESEILVFNSKISEKAVLKQDIQAAIKDGKIVLKGVHGDLREHIDKTDYDSALRLRLLELKDKYLDFSRDHTRVSSMRQMSSEFVKEIETILKNKR